jgi:hypothetical protein
MLSVVPKHLFSWDCDLCQGETLVGTLELAPWSESAAFRAQGRTWQLGREGWFHGRYFLRQNGRTLATAEKENILLREFEVRCDAETYQWHARMPLMRAFVLEQGGAQVGSMVPEALFTRRAEVLLPEGLSVERKAFLIWLALLMWRREHRRA